DRQLAFSNAKSPRLGERGEDVPSEADTARFHFVTPGGYCGRDSRSLLRVELDVWVAVREKHVLHRSSCALWCPPQHDAIHRFPNSAGVAALPCASVHK